MAFIIYSLGKGRGGKERGVFWCHCNLIKFSMKNNFIDKSCKIIYMNDSAFNYIFFAIV